MLVGMAEGAGMVLCVLWDSEEASRRVKGKPMYCQSPHAPTKKESHLEVSQVTLW